MSQRGGTDSIEPWNNWYHVSGSTYGTWLRGDPRGWRARKHREHVEGDYKQPPPRGVHDDELENSKRSMKRERVVLTRAEREIVCWIFKEQLERNKAEIVDLCIGGKHYHVLARFTPAGLKPEWNKHRIVVGRAKGASARALSKLGLRPQGGVWGKRCKAKPVRCRAHQVNIAKYIKDHVKQGAVVLSLLKQDAHRTHG